MRLRRVPVLVALFLFAVVSRSVAQQEPDPADGARFRFGPLRFTPWILVSNVGFDDNIFNETDNPKRDNTAAVGPAADIWMHAGPSLISARVVAQYLYYQTYATERAWNTMDNLKWSLPLGRITPFVIGSYSSMKTRTFEIDARIRQISESAGLGAEVRVSPRTHITLSGQRARTIYADNAQYGGVNLAAALNETYDTEQIQLRYKLTALTNFLVNADAIQDRFDGDRVRNADSIRVMPGFEMKAGALVAGRVFVGYRHFQPLAETIPPYDGPVAAVDASLTARATRVSARIGRDLLFSTQESQPYYALTDLGLSLTQRLTRVWEVTASGGRQTLDYSKVITVAGPAQQDVIRSLGGGIGYRFSRVLRVGVDAAYYRRASTALAHDYKGLRAGLSFSYGLPQ